MKFDSLTKNTIYLYLLTASKYLFGLITIPYITRILGPSIYGNLGFAMAIGGYFNLLIDFGFILSGTKRVATYAYDKEELSKILTGVSITKILLSLILMVLLAISSLYIKIFRENLTLLYLYLILSCISSLLPDYIYRGLEDMKMITYRSVFVRGFFTFLIFIFLKTPEQIYYIPGFQIIGSALAFIWVYWDISKRHNIHFTRVSVKTIRNLLAESYEYFISRIASSIYSASNIVILGFLFAGQPVVGYYSSAEKFKDLGQQACTPIADSFYPYMIRTKDFKRLYSTLIKFSIPILIGCIIILIWAEPICRIAFGDDFANSAPILRWMLPIILITLPNYLLGFPAMTAIGKSKWANYSVEIAMLWQVIGIALLLLANSVSAISLCVLTFSSQFITLIIRLIILFKNHSRLKQTIN